MVTLLLLGTLALLLLDDLRLRAENKRLERVRRANLVVIRGTA